MVEVWMHISPSGSMVMFLTLLSGSPLEVSSILNRYPSVCTEEDDALPGRHKIPSTVRNMIA